MSVNLDTFDRKVQGIPKLIEVVLQKIGDLDLELLMTTREIEKASDRYLSALVRCENQPDKLKRLNSMCEKAKRIQDQKVKLSEDLYKFVDKKANKLQHFIDEFKMEMEEREANIRRTVVKKISNGSRLERRSKPTKKRKRGPSSSDEKKIKCARRMKRVDFGSSDETEDDSSEMPVDPNEPVFCSCKQVSFGNMIACDRPDCLIEWFHFGCVGLKTAPEGKWYCPQCRKKIAEKKKLTREARGLFV